jgi:iron(III)-enterobactin esterase
MSLLSEHLIPATDGNFSRKAWLLESDVAQPEEMAIFLDGEFYLQGMGTAELVDRLRSEGVIPSLPILFLSHLDLARRHHELTCDESFADFVATDVVAWMRQRYPSLAAGDHLLAGPSLGGLQATFTVLRHPGTYTRCLSHAGSYWWNGEWLTNHLEEIPDSPSRFWLSVGDRETVSGITHAPTGMRQDVSQRDACERFNTALSHRGHEVHFHLFPGAHDFRCWAAELPAALAWLLR